MSPRSNKGTTILISAANLDHGGGVQVASSFIDELQGACQDEEILSRFPWVRAVDIEASPAVLRNLTAPRVLSVRQVRRKWWTPKIWLPSRPQYLVEFTIFGPRYGWRRGITTLTGLADGTSVFPIPAGVPKAGPLGIVRRFVRGLISRTAFRRESLLVAEGTHIADAYSARTKYLRENIRVIPNVVNRAVLDTSLQTPLGRELRAEVAEETYLVAYVAKSYAHKNHDYLPRLRAELHKHGINVMFVVTLSEQEWTSKSDCFRASCLNVGTVDVNQLADLYGQCTAGIFPSLLESFSVTPLEILATNGLLFSSDREFVKEVCGDAALYFDPLDPFEGARVIAEMLVDVELQNKYRDRARELTSALPTSSTRMIEYLRVMDQLVSSSRNPIGQQNGENSDRD